MGCLTAPKHQMSRTKELQHQGTLGPLIGWGSGRLNQRLPGETPLPWAKLLSDVRQVLLAGQLSDAKPSSSAGSGADEASGRCWGPCSTWTRNCPALSQPASRQLTKL